MSRESASERAKRLHREAVVIDCHSDLLMPIADGWVRMGRQVAPPDPGAWKPPFEMAEGRDTSRWPAGAHFGCIGQYSIPQLLSGGVTVEVCAIFVEDHRLETALRRGMEMVAWLRREVEENPELELVTTAGDIERIKAQGKCGAVMALEGTELLGQDLLLLEPLYALGVRMAGLAHNRRNAFSDGTQYHVKTGGLTELGKRAVKRMNELGIVVDVGHLNLPGFFEALEISSAPVVLSHRSPRKFFPVRPEDSPLHGPYDLSRGREGLEALARNGGVFGVFFLKAKDAEDVVADMEYAMELMGPDHVGLGSDLYGLETAPEGLEDISKVPAITEALVRRGHSDEVILKILGGNFMRVFRSVWGR